MTEQSQFAEVAAVSANAATDDVELDFELELDEALEAALADLKSKAGNFEDVSDNVKREGSMAPSDPRQTAHASMTFRSPSLEHS